jgi:hypothetical protein
MLHISIITKKARMYVPSFLESEKMVKKSTTLVTHIDEANIIARMPVNSYMYAGMRKSGYSDPAKTAFTFSASFSGDVIILGR